MTPPKAHEVRATKGEKATAARTLLVEHAAELLTLRGPGGPRVRETAANLGIVEDGAVYVEGDRIVDVGTAFDVLSRHPRADVRIDAAGCVTMPGFVDAHTHAIFGGSREHEVEWKAQGLGYAESAPGGEGTSPPAGPRPREWGADPARPGPNAWRRCLRAGRPPSEAN